MYSFPGTNPSIFTLSPSKLALTFENSSLFSVTTFPSFPLYLKLTAAGVLLLSYLTPEGNVTVTSVFPFTVLLVVVFIVVLPVLLPVVVLELLPELPELPDMFPLPDDTLLLIVAFTTFDSTLLVSFPST